MNAVTKAIIETIGAADFTVQLRGQDGQNVVDPVNEETDETFVVRGDDLSASSWPYSLGVSAVGSPAACERTRQ